MTEQSQTTDQASMQRMASPQEIADAKLMLEKVRNIVAQFHEIRRKNNERVAGLRPSVMPLGQLQQFVRQQRDPQMEERAVAALRQLISVIHGRDPTRQEIQEGIPNGFEESLGLGAWPALVAVTLASSGAVVYSYFSYLRATEETIQLQSATPFERAVNAISNNIWGIAAVAGAGVFGYYLYQRRQPEGQIIRKRVTEIPYEEEEVEEVKRLPARRKNPKKNTSKEMLETVSEEEEEVESEEEDKS